MPIGAIGGPRSDFGDQRRQPSSEARLGVVDEHAACGCQNSVRVARDQIYRRNADSEAPQQNLVFSPSLGRRTGQGGVQVLKRLLVVFGIVACAAGFAGRAQAAGVSDQYIVVLKPGADRSAAAEYARSLGGTVLMLYKNALNGYAVRLPSSALPLINADSRVRFVSANRSAALTAQTLPPASTGSTANLATRA